MKESSYKNYDKLSLFLNSETVAKVLGVSPSSAYKLMHKPVEKHALMRQQAKNTPCASL